MAAIASAPCFPGCFNLVEEDLVKLSPRSFFLAALTVYLLWVAVLAGLALTTSTRPAARIAPVDVEVEGGTAGPAPAPARSL